MNSGMGVAVPSIKLIRIPENCLQWVTRCFRIASRKQNFKLGVNPFGYGLSYLVGGENLLTENPRERGSEQWSLGFSGMDTSRVFTKLVIAWDTTSQF